MHGRKCSTPEYILRRFFCLSPLATATVLFLVDAAVHIVDFGSDFLYIVDVEFYSNFYRVSCIVVLSVVIGMS